MHTPNTKAIYMWIEYQISLWKSAGAGYSIGGSTDSFTSGLAYLVEAKALEVNCKEIFSDSNYECLNTDK